MMCYTAHGAYTGSESSCRNLEQVVFVSESTVLYTKTIIYVSIGLIHCKQSIVALVDCHKLYVYELTYLLCATASLYNVQFAK